MTKLSINVNKVALYRNSRHGNYPSVQRFASDLLHFGADGITVHPRPDERHLLWSDIPELKSIVENHGSLCELNIEGYPSKSFIDKIISIKPNQCTLVPDSSDQITSDHGWDIEKVDNVLRDAIKEISDAGIRVSVFVDAGSTSFDAIRICGAQRIEIYTGPYAEAYNRSNERDYLGDIMLSAKQARVSGLGVNAGHDLNIRNVETLTASTHIDEVSIGHSFFVEAMYYSMPALITRYKDILKGKSIS